MESQQFLHRSEVKRLLPKSTQLLRCGFADYLDSGDETLFSAA